MIQLIDFYIVIEIALKQKDKINIGLD